MLPTAPHNLGERVTRSGWFVGIVGGLAAIPMVLLVGLLVLGPSLRVLGIDMHW